MNKVRTIIKGKKFLEQRGEKDLEKVKNEVHNDKTYMKNGISFLADLLADYLLRDKNNIDK
jgi:uncharacterized protein YcbK (DUF882 family)